MSESPSKERNLIFKALKTLPHDSRYLGFLVTKKAKELGLVGMDKPNLKGNTIDNWAVSSALDGKNTPNAWACTAAVRVLVDMGYMAQIKASPLVFAYYYDPDPSKIQESLRLLIGDNDGINTKY